MLQYPKHPYILNLMTDNGKVKIIICPDSFKGSLSASEAALSIERGIVDSGCKLPLEILKIPLADGGEGTAEALVEPLAGRFIKADVHDPLMRLIKAPYLLSGDGDTAVVEMAAASGLCLLSDDEKNPLITTTYGTGELIASAAGTGVKHIMVCIGGSATNDGGSGAARALGIRFLDENDKELEQGGLALSRLARIDMSSFILAQSGIKVSVACDVTNPLVGPEGASAIYGPQKGADPEMVSQLDAALTRYAGIVEHDIGVSIADMPGAGAAGGLGAGLAAFLGAELKSGIETVLNAVRFDEKLAGADLVITGEGSLDRQTAYGKTIGGVLQRIRQHNIPCIAFGGRIGDIAALYDLGITSAFPITPGPMSLEDSMSSAGDLLRQASERVFRLFANIFEKKLLSR